MLDQESQNFLQGIRDTCGSRVTEIAPGTELWRAQMGHDTLPYIQHEIHVDDIYVPYSESRMRPLPTSASEGRANPKGIPCLYVASNKETAMSEIRPWLGSHVSVAKFRNRSLLRLIDFSKYHDDTLPFHFGEPDDNKKIKSVWTHIDKAFSEPVTNSDQKSDYAPTQIIAELIKSLGYDGIAFKSSLNSGVNYALFDLDAVEFVACNLFKVSNLEFSFENTDDERYK
ncbi:RES family NAD+ phosphorylase [Vibrio harveyi]|uniref:RES family NAD+ phosphorylase n=1 Tax=Vibrio harveyi TaxID=669 RepID=UPI001E5FFF27|nr:RES family NAD+ phosphorylase [Vibrio harveyi]